MTLQVQCTTPNRTFRRVMRKGDRMRVGHSPWLEFAFPAELGLNEEHFAIEYQNEPIVQSLDGAMIEVDGVAKAQTIVGSFTVIKAGDVVFELTRLGQTANLVQGNQSANGEQPEAEPWKTKSSILEITGLSAVAKEIIVSSHAPSSAILQLKEMSLLEDAIRVLSCVLPTRIRIHWLLEVLLHHEISADASLIETALQWRDDPSEDNRAYVASLVPWHENASPWTWLLAAISWTAGTLSGNSEIPISPNDGMIVSAVIASLQLATCKTDAVAFRNYCMEKGLIALQNTTDGGDS